MKMSLSNVVSRTRQCKRPLATPAGLAGVDRGLSVELGAWALGVISAIINLPIIEKPIERLAPIPAE